MESRQQPTRHNKKSPQAPPNKQAESATIDVHQNKLSINKPDNNRTKQPEMPSNAGPIQAATGPTSTALAPSFQSTEVRPVQSTDVPPVQTTGPISQPTIPKQPKHYQCPRGVRH